MYYFLGQAVNFSEDPIIHNNYIMSAVKVGDLGAVENTVSKSNFYEPAVIRFVVVIIIIIFIIIIIIIIIIFFLFFFF